MAIYSPEQDLREEKLSSITHLLGIIFGLVCIPILIFQASEKVAGSTIFGIILYGLSFLMVFTFSTLFHWPSNNKLRKVFLILDHISIYFLIAGTYTPFILIFINNSFGMLLLSVLWSLTLLGTFFKIFYTDRFKLVSTAIYVAMGWMLLIGVREFFANMPHPIVVLIVTGGVLYSIGVLFYIWRFFAYTHVVWHLFVLSAAICHFSAVLMSVVP
jgi:hemolysin III